MYRIDNANATTVLPTPLAAGPVVHGYFQSGNPPTGVKATTVDRDWANAVQEEICAVIEAAGITLSKTNRTQLLAAVNALFLTQAESDARYLTQAQGDTRYVNVTGDAMTGILSLSGNPTSALHAATKSYVDGMIAGGGLVEPVGAGTWGRLTTGVWQRAVAIAGDTMTGLLSLSGAPTSNLHAATKLYVDSSIAALGTVYVNQTGDTMTGGLNVTGLVVTASGANITGAIVAADANFSGNVEVQGNFDVKGQGVAYTVAAPNNAEIGWGWDGTNLLPYVAGAWAGTNVALQSWVIANFAPISDERVKTDIAPATVGLAEVLRIEPISYRRDPAPVYGGTGSETEIGFSAQQMQTVIPEAVFETSSATPVEDGKGPLVEQPPILGVAPQPIIAALVNGMKELTARIAVLEARLATA